MKLEINLGEELKNAEMTHNEKVPVTYKGEFIGEATLDKNLKYDLNIVNKYSLEKIKDILELGWSGKVIERKNGSITKFKLMEVSICFKKS